jgi:hypothetical protein
MKARLFLVKRMYFYESGCSVTLFTLTNEDIDLLRYLDEVIEHSLKNFDKSIEYFQYEEITHFENWAMFPHTSDFLEQANNNFFNHKN